MNRIFICGDIHGEVLAIEDFISRNGGKACFDRSDKMILLGDIGLNYFLDKRDEKRKAHLDSLPLTFYCVRGNHEKRPSVLAAEDPDNWRYFYDDELQGMLYCEIDYPSIFYFDDNPALYQIGDYQTLVMGGAYSVDKFYRLAKKGIWFEDEQMTKEEMERAIDICENISWKVDLVLTHTCPSIFEPTDLFLSVVDQNLVDKTMEFFFNEIEYKLDYKAWMWGHYHEFRDYPRLDGKRKLMLFNSRLIELNQYMTEDMPQKL